MGSWAKALSCTPVLGKPQGSKCKYPIVQQEGFEIRPPDLHVNAMRAG